MSDADRLRIAGDEWQTGWARLASGQTVQLARPIERLGARILDYLIVAIPSVVIWAVIRGRDAFVTDESTSLAGLERLAVTELGALLLGVSVALIYEVVPTARWGQTLGKRVLGINVVNVATGEPPSFGKSLGRWALLTLPITIPYVRYPGVVFFLLCVLTIGHEPFFRGWHDKAARTLVVTSRRDDRDSGRPRPVSPRYGRRR